MRFNFEKETRIILDMIVFCHKLGAEDYRTYLKTEDGVSKMQVKCTIPKVPQVVLEELRQELNIPRQREIEQEFWGLSGEDETGTELTLVGMMIDGAEITYEDEVLTFDMFRIE